MKRVAIFGATSAIARGAARIWADQGGALCLVARDATRLEAERADLEVRAHGRSTVSAVVGDSSQATGQAELVTQVAHALGGEIDVALVCFGVLPDPERADGDLAYAMETMRVNFASTASLVALLAARMATRADGVIAVVSSVAGDRGRGSNVYYGAAKAGLSAYLSGMRSRLSSRGVHVMTLKPGFVDTPMTAHLPHNALYASPHDIGRGIVRAVDGRRDVVYLPWFWRWIMLVVRLIPERVFKRLKI